MPASISQKQNVQEMMTVMMTVVMRMMTTMTKTKTMIMIAVLIKNLDTKPQTVTSIFPRKNYSLDIIIDYIVT
jgi:hypothetical protein